MQGQHVPTKPSRSMRLFEAIIDANHRAVAGDASAGLHPAEFADELPVIALTCIDPRLNAFFPNALALPAEEFIWLRNAGNIITGTLSSTLRSLALACAVKGGREIAIIGHTDCHIAKTTTTVLLDKLKELGVQRSLLPENLSEFFGTFGSERQNIIKACDLVRNSPLIGPKIPVHGLLLDTETGKLDWVVNGYETLQTHLPPVPPGSGILPKLGNALESLGAFKEFAMGEMKFPDMKIGEAALPGKPPEAAPFTPPTTATLPPLKISGRIPVPPPIRPRPTFSGGRQDQRPRR
jgi:carbonic anhydrase